MILYLSIGMIIIQIFLFLVLVTVLNKIMFCPILKAIEDRDQYFKDAKKKIANIELETTELVGKCVSIEKDAKAAANNSSSELKKEALNVAERTFNEAMGEISSIRDEVGKEIENQLQKARQSLQDEAAVLADSLIEKVIDRRVSN